MDAREWQTSRWLSTAPEGSSRRGNTMSVSSVDSSINHFRNASRVFCILMGETGAGKTSLANHMIGLDDSTGISESTSATTSVISYTAEVSFPSSSGKKFTIVDTPGLHDTRGLKQDACNMNSIKKYCESYIGDGLGLKFPNFLFLCVKSTDNRVIGDQSSIAKNVRTLKSVSVLDTKMPNVIVVVTFACSLAHQKVSTWVEHKKRVAGMYQKFFSDTFHIEVPVVFIENQFDAFELDTAADIEGTLLPDGEVQPLNLMTAMQNVARRNNDNFAVEIIQQMIKTGCKKGSFRHDHTVAAKLAATETLSAEEQMCLNLLLGNEEAYKYYDELQKKAKRDYEAQLEADRRRRLKEIEDESKRRVEAAKERQRSAELNLRLLRKNLEKTQHRVELERTQIENSRRQIQNMDHQIEASKRLVSAHPRMMVQSGPANRPLSFNSMVVPRENLFDTLFPELEGQENTFFSSFSGMSFNTRNK